MAEVTLRSIDPLAYHVNNVSDLDRRVVTAYKKDDQERLKELLSIAKYDYNVFICINNGWHAFLLCVPVGSPGPDDPFQLMPDADKKPYEIPDVNICHKIELTFQDVELKTYRIKKEYTIFSNVKDSIKKSYYIAKYKGTSPFGLDLASLRASPHRYRVLLDDCVEFAKGFCRELLVYCENWREIKEEVQSRIKEAAATGLSIETMSRRVESSALLGNTFLNSFVGGLDVSSYLSGTRGTVVLIVAGLIFFILIYPIIVTVVVIKFYGK